MPIIYSLVARGTVVLAEHTDSSGNFITVTQRILEKIPSDDSKMSYVYDKFIFHYIVSDGITYMCMADEKFGRRIPFSFLDNIKNRFISTYGNYCKTAVAYSFNAEFSRVLQVQMKYFSTDPGADRITQVRGEIDEVKTVMVANIEKVLERGERIELLVEQTETLHANAFEFKKGSTKLKRAMWWKNVKITIILVVIILVIVFVATVVACGGIKFSKCVNRGKDIVLQTSTTAASTTSVAATTSYATAGSTTASSAAASTTSFSFTSPSDTTGLLVSVISEFAENIVFE